MRTGYIRRECKDCSVVWDGGDMIAMSEGCPACGRKFNLGEPVVMACGAWEGPPKYIHENEAIFDKKAGSYFERRCYASRKTN